MIVISRGISKLPEGYVSHLSLTTCFPNFDISSRQAMSPSLQLRIISVGSFCYCWELNPLVCWQEMKGWDTLLYDDFVRKYIVNTNEWYQLFDYLLPSFRFCLLMHIVWVGLFLNRIGQRWADVKVVVWSFGTEGSDRSFPFLRWIQGKQSFWWRHSPLVPDNPSDLCSCGSLEVGMLVGTEGCSTSSGA